MARADWVVMDAATGKLACRRCGDSEQVNLPLRLDVFIFQAKSYARLHGRCKGGGHGR